jgi:phenylpyruvate tautomerase PptA (4-oxalocrotonate tautomerase family)
VAQLKIYAAHALLREHADTLSDALQRAAVQALGLPEEKRFHRFLPLEPWQTRTPPDRSERYLIIEVMMFTGRSVDSRKAYIRTLITEVTEALHLDPADVEITLLESPRENWGIRGVTADELQLNYKVEV